MIFLVATVFVALGLALGYGIHWVAGSYQMFRFHRMFVVPFKTGGQPEDQSVVMHRTLIEATIIRLVLAALVVALGAYLYLNTSVLPDAPSDLRSTAAISASIAFAAYIGYFIFRSAHAIRIIGRSKENAL